MKAEKDSKAELIIVTGKSPSSIREWLQSLKDNCEKYARDYNNQDYLCFKDYNPNQKTLTPKQMRVFKKHYGYEDEPKPEIKTQK